MPALDNQLLDTLNKNGQIKPGDLQWLKTELISSLEPVEALLLKHNLVSETEIAKAKAAILKVEYVDVATASVVPEAINVLPEAVAEKYLCLPFNLDKTNKVLSVAMADPADLPAIEFIEKKTGLKIKPYLAEASLLLKEISSRYSQSLSSEVTAALKETITAKPTFSQLDSLTAGGGVIREAPISKIVSTILEFAMKARDLPELGLRGRALLNLQNSIRVPHGIILVTGPTGSGKTTTLYSILSKINTPKVNIMTLEDPVEYQMTGITQVQINPQAGLTFASGMRSFLRQDPDIIMVGEVRDIETAELAIQAALTGHLVFSTLHTNSAAGALPRLLDMKAEPYLLASSITAIVAQRVAGKICSSCKMEYEPESPIVKDMEAVLGKFWPHEPGKKVTLFKGKGCDQCNNRGFRGRIGIFEVLPVTERGGRLILERAAAAEIEKLAVEEGMISMKQDGYLKVVEGVTSIDEVLRVAQE